MQQTPTYGVLGKCSLSLRLYITSCPFMGLWQTSFPNHSARTFSSLPAGFRKCFFDVLFHISPEESEEFIHAPARS